MASPSSSHSDLPTPPAGFKKLLDRLKKAGLGPEGSLSSIEATGHYWSALFNSWPLMAMTLRTLKTDAIDAAMIAELMRYKRYEPFALDERRAARTWARYYTSLAEELDHAQKPHHSHPRRPVPRLV